MKVLQIRMQQFGPYVDEVIDFTELNEQRLFLLEGKTGSGKSTIIEGIVFALFGKDSKGRDEDVRRISAPADQNATVTLEFEVEGCLYRVVRSPMWQKEGVKTKKLQSVTLAEIDADGNVIAGRTWDAVKEVDGTKGEPGRITQLIRLNRQQFTRIVVLPQGQFAEFLKSKPEDRKKLLEAIFPVDDWKEIQKRIRQDAKDARDERALLLDAAKQVAAVTRDHTNADSDADDDEDTETLENINEVREIQSDAESKITEWTEAIESEEKELTKRRNVVDDQKKVLDKQAKMNKAIGDRADLLKEKDGLDGLEKSITPMREAKEKHQDAEKLKPVRSQLDTSKAALVGNATAIDAHINGAGMEVGLKEKSPIEIKESSDSIAAKVTKVGTLANQQNQKNETTESLEVLEKNVTDAHVHHSKLQLEQHKAWAAQIAKDSLKSGDPCLVCGSIEHPTPADDEGDENAELQGAVTDVGKAEAAQKYAIKHISKLSISIQDIRSELKLSEGDAIPDVANLEAERDALQALYDLKHANDTLSTTLSSAQSAWEAAENPHKLETMEQIEALILGPDKKEELSEAIATYDNRRAINTNGLQKQEVIDAEDKQVVDISKNLEEIGEVEDALAVDEKAHYLMKTRLSDLESSQSTLSSSIDVFTDYVAGIADLIWVDRHLRGIQGAKVQMDVIGWLLRRWFESALAEANARLTEIGSGRYYLEMVQAGKDDKKAGLNIGVVDALSDSLKPRSTNSLSGGESFYVSLALALGMSDVVSQEAGGVRLGTLFIDEGFGSLDQEMLDDVMGVIDDVGGTDRIIGLISHIESLKQRISSRISVTKKGDGTSTTEVIA